MNERIKTMWEESTGSVWPRPGKFTAGEYDHNLEKFAELIVRECISCSTFIGITTHNSGLGPQPIRYTSMVNDKIRKHFGVEE